MFDNNSLEKWISKKSEECMDKITRGEDIKPEESVILILKAQTNHFAHLDQDLRKDMINLDLNLKQQMINLDINLRKEMIDLRKDIDKRFEQVDKRFEQVDKRFEQVDKRFDKTHTIMMWGFGLVFAGIILPLVVPFLKK